VDQVPLCRCVLSSDDLFDCCDVPVCAILHSLQSSGVPFKATEIIETGWWFGTFFIFPSIGNVIIPTDSYFSEGWRKTTRKDGLALEQSDRFLDWLSRCGDFFLKKSTMLEESPATWTIMDPQIRVFFQKPGFSMRVAKKKGFLKQFFFFSER